MRKSAVIFVAGLFLAAAAYCALYFGATAGKRELLGGNAPELLWLKREFNLSDAEFERVSKLHGNYLPECKEMSRRIDQTNAVLKQMLSSGTNVTPEVENALADAAELRLHCQKMMLKHFYEVAATMPPAQGKRYLEWVQEKTFLPHYGMCPQCVK